ncbi:hypothetical protein pipiens_017484, partial [Culex pipiens pipiens]
FFVQQEGQPTAAIKEEDFGCEKVPEPIEAPDPVVPLAEETVTEMVDNILDKVEELVQFEAVPLIPVADELIVEKAKPKPIPGVDS